MHKVKELFLITLVTLLGTYLFFGHLFFSDEPRMFAQPDYGMSDLWHQSYASKFLLHEGLQSGELPLWNPYVGAGFPEFAKAEMGALYLPNLILFSQLDFPVAMNMVYVVAFVMMAVGMYWYGRILKLHPLAAVAMGLVFAMSGYVTVHVMHVSRLQTVSVIPWVLIAVYYLIKKPSGLTASASALIAAQMVYAGHFQTMFMTGLLLVAVAVNYWFKKKLTTRVFMYSFVALGLFSLLVAVQLLPAFELISSTSRGQGFSQADALKYSFSWESLKYLIAPFVDGSPIDGTWPHFSLNDGNIYWENVAYMGWVVIMLAFVGLYSVGKSITGRALIGLGGMSLLLMTGKYSPLYFIHSILPFSFFRAPAKYVLLLVIVLVILYGFGTNFVMKVTQKRWKSKKVSFSLGVVILSISMYQLWQFNTAYRVTDSAENWLSEPTVSQYLEDNDTYRYHAMASSNRWNTFMQESGWKNLEPYHYLRNALAPNINMLYGLNSFGTYAVLQVNRHDITSDIIDILHVTREENDDTRRTYSHFMSLMNIKYIVTPSLQEGLDEIAIIPAPDVYVDSGEPEVHVYELPDTLPRVRFAGKVEHIDTARDMLEHIGEEDFDIAGTVLSEDDVPSISVAETESDTQPVASITRESFNTRIINVFTPNPSYLVLAETYDEGWKAFLDGEEIEIYPANILHKMIVVPEGDHVIEFVYEPTSFTQGVQISIIGYILTILLVGGSCLPRFVQFFLANTKQSLHR